ncbi:MAG: NACHT domain-containing protein [Candidatus Accumulibacter phosphatis]|uniref:NACHT domain-containing protein n=1 Tax=Candidatus Accumulibacter sp. ACC012 TaxID=2823332 RepID=UPI0025BABD21|nr:NACHT domain-containing protein [Candidatus Accumulibacter sp. ACC012]
MDYPFENLSPEKFQLFCQALLAKEYPGVQCFPIAQPDGGRDATQMHFGRGRGREFAIIQVKFVRNPFTETDPHKWLSEIVAKEIPKVKKQVLVGAKFFALMTNVPGTAHLDAGSIDRVNKTLSDELGIPSMCLWRNDLNRRLDGTWDLKWAYPELMTGPDFIRLVIEGNLSESKERRATAIRAFVKTQFATDEYVKFKQVDLDNRLLDLFIDVPIAENIGGRWLHARWLANFQKAANHDYWVEQLGVEIDDETIRGLTRPEHVRVLRSKSVGAATFLLGDDSAARWPFTVVEGAPGQGKSTIAQYLCQVHRMRLLERQTELQQIPENHRCTTLRLPIKVDLRDFAVWLAKRNPFTAETEEIPTTLWDRSLESFLAALIRSQSGGAQFDVSDLHSVARLSSVLLVLDGLDEVADIKRREEVVSEIVKGSERLLSLSAALQVVVTSRPAAFENSPGLPEGKFRYISLDYVTQELIDEYAGKWLRARRLNEKESSEVRKILREKLNEPHLRDLARNPMQLTILLSLIHTRGVSLPDKRTALYDSYVDLFFNRECEKSMIVRENREVLIDIHRYLAWLLHVESEQAAGNAVNQPAGAIEETRLKAVLRNYLVTEGRDPELAEVLFTGLIERVVALVSRVQGTYEFEVQPLREYFAARFLHETAPYSPVGDEKRGTRPDRFDAIARNFYWLNVTRFYAGCYSKGELASLIDRLGELIGDSEFRHLSHPRVLGATLLGDWVFTQHPKSVSAVVHKVLDGLGLRFLLTSTSRRQSNAQPLILPVACGKAELVEKCILMLRGTPPKDFALDVLDLLRANTTREEVTPQWSVETSSVTGVKRTTWLEYGLHLGCVPTLDPGELDVLLTDGPLSTARIEVLLKSRRVEFFEGSDSRRRAITNALLDRCVSISFGLRHPSILEAFGQTLNPERYALAFLEASPVPLAELLNRYSPRGSSVIKMEAFGTADWAGVDPFKEVVAIGIECQGIEAARWATELPPWEKLVDTLSTHFGEQWAARQLSNIAAGIKTKSENCTDFPDLYDSQRSLCRRVRYARLRAGTSTWWSKHLQDAADAEQQMFCCLVYFTWASPNSVSQTLKIADAIVAAFSEQQWFLLFDLVEEAVALTRPHVRDKNVSFFEAEKHSFPLSQRTLALLRLRTGASAVEQLYQTWLSKNGTWDSRGLHVFQQDAIQQLLRHPKESEKHLDVLSAGYVAGVLSEPFASHRYSRRDLLRDVPVRLAMEIVERADCFPSFLVAAAEGRCRAETAKKIRPVGKVAEEDGWFTQH